MVSRTCLSFLFLFASVHSIKWSLMVMSALATRSQAPNLAWYSSHSTNLAFTLRSKVWPKWLSGVLLVQTTQTCIFSPFHPSSNGNEGLFSKQADNNLTCSGVVVNHKQGFFLSVFLVRLGFVFVAGGRRLRRKFEAQTYQG